MGTGRFWAREDSGAAERAERGAYGLASLLSILVLLAVIAEARLTFFLAPLSPFVDPAISEALSLGKPAVAYAVFRGGDPPGGLRRWVFGDTVIVKLNISSRACLEALLRRPGLLGLWAPARPAQPPLPAPPPRLLADGVHDFAGRDVKLEFHRANPRWTGRGVTVAIIDSGIDYTHPDFFDEENRTKIVILVSALYASNSGAPIVWIPGVNGTLEDLLALDRYLWGKYGEPAFLDINGHGTHVAGIIAGTGRASGGKYRGIAPDAKLVIIKAFDRNGGASLDACLTALEWVYRHAEDYNITILNLSWGVAMPNAGDDPLSAACDAIARDHKVLIFAAAGNLGNIPGTVTVPAAARYVFAVGAWDPYTDSLAWFSSIGPTQDLRLKPDFVGAGVLVVSCRSRYAQFPERLCVGQYYVALSGTSMATPCCAAVAACFVEYFGFYHHGRRPTPDDFLRFVIAAGRRVSPVRDFITGYGVPLCP